MKFKLTQELEKIRRQLRLTQQRLQKEKAELLEVMGTQLLSDAQLDYLTKSRGGTGEDGVTWDPVKNVKRKNKRGDQKEGRKTKSGKAMPGPGDNDIGIDTGLQRDSASPGFIGADGKGGNLFEQDEDGVTVGYNREYSEFFDEKRPLLPETLPPAWVEKQEEIIRQWAEKIMEEGTEGI